MKKYLNLLLLGCSTLFTALLFATMAAAGVVASANLGIGTLSTEQTIYELMSGKFSQPIAVVCLVLTIVSLVALAITLTLEVMKKFKKYNKFIALVAAVLLLANGVLFFCLATGDTYKNFSLGIGAILSGVLSLLAAGCALTYGFCALNKK